MLDLAPRKAFTMSSQRWSSRRRHSPQENQRLKPLARTPATSILRSIWATPMLEPFQESQGRPTTSVYAVLQFGRLWPNSIGFALLVNSVGGRRRSKARANRRSDQHAAAAEAAARGGP
jgi:hypothetical protein